MATNSTTKIIAVSAALLVLGGLGLALAYKRKQIRKRREKNIAIQLV